MTQLPSDLDRETVREIYFAEQQSQDAAFERWVVSPRTTIGELQTVCKVALQAGNLKHAYIAQREIVSRNPQDVEALRMMAVVLRRKQLAYQALAFEGSVRYLHEKGGSVHTQAVATRGEISKIMTV